MGLAAIFGPDLLVVTLLLVWGVPIWAILDASSRSRAAFYRAGSSKTGWIVVIAASAFLLGPIGMCLAAIYLLWVRPKVKRAAA
jgi:hypothetical protein